MCDEVNYQVKISMRESVTFWKERWSCEGKSAQDFVTGNLDCRIRLIPELVLFWYWFVFGNTCTILWNEISKISAKIASIDIFLTEMIQLNLRLSTCSAVQNLEGFSWDRFHACRIAKLCSARMCVIPYISMKIRNDDSIFQIPKMLP